MDDAVTYLISNLFLVACYIVDAGRSPVALVKSPAVKARIVACGTVRAFAYGAEFPATMADVLNAYKARKVTITDFGTSIVIQARWGRGRARTADARFVVSP